MPVTKDNVEDVFTYHSPKPGQPEKYTAVRGAAKLCAVAILEHVPACADQQAALRLLREAVMTANAAIALEGKV
jgi:hypothetical protein